MRFDAEANIVGTPFYSGEDAYATISYSNDYKLPSTPSLLEIQYYNASIYPN